jgi:hypothetical protein
MKRPKEKYCKGKPVSHTCDHEKLANYFGKNPDAPHYLTPVHFRREVLQKYYDNPQKYLVEDALIRCGGHWSIRIDDDLQDRVIVWLGDLGRDVAEEERLHWQHYNIPPEGGISKTSYTRNIRGWFADPQMPDLVFKHLYPSVNSNLKKKNGWSLFLSLQGDDQHVFQTLRVPLTNNQAEFDGQILSLAKVLVDSLNEPELVQGLPQGQKMKRASASWPAGSSITKSQDSNCTLNFCEICKISERAARIAKAINIKKQRLSFKFRGMVYKSLEEKSSISRLIS